jgi:Na+-translocating ferredoxin:NAD+ oxidoreductase RnfG subunit
MNNLKINIMKKLILSAAIVLGSFTTYATTLPTTNSVTTSQSIQEEYTEVKLEEVPEAIKAALKTAYPDAILDKAYINANKEYKLDITVGDKKGNLFADANGKWIQK